MFDFHDPVAAWSHLLMAGWSVVAGAFLLRMARNHSRPKRASLFAYAASVVALYAASGLFHSIAHLPGDASFRLWQRLDQTAIFLLIYGSNVPMLGYVLPKRERNRMLAGMGAVAAVGIASLWAFPKPPYTLTVCVYLGMGILGLVPMRSYYRKLGRRGLYLIARFAAFYVAGGLCEVFEWPSPLPGFLGYHEMMHFLDVFGTLGHYGLLWHVVTSQPSRAASPSASFAAPALRNPS